MGFNTPQSATDHFSTLTALTKLYNNSNTQHLFPLIALSFTHSLAKCKIGLLSANSAASWGAHSENGRQLQVIMGKGPHSLVSLSSTPAWIHLLSAAGSFPV